MSAVQTSFSSNTTSNSRFPRLGGNSKVFQGRNFGSARTHPQSSLVLIEDSTGGVLQQVCEWTGTSIQYVGTYIGTRRWRYQHRRGYGVSWLDIDSRSPNIGLSAPNNGKKGVKSEEKFHFIRILMVSLGLFTLCPPPPIDWKLHLWSFCCNMHNMPNRSFNIHARSAYKH